MDAHLGRLPFGEVEVGAFAGDKVLEEAVNFGHEKFS